jgi:uncharacterized membrane protein
MLERDVGPRPGARVLLAYLESVNWRLVGTWAAGLAVAAVLLALGLPLVVVAVGLLLLGGLSCSGAVRDHLAVRRSLDGQHVVRPARRLRRRHHRAPGRARRLLRTRPRRLVRRRARH